MNLGLFNGKIKHQINIGEAAAIKQRIRRTPLNLKKTKLNQMIDRRYKPYISDRCPVLVLKKDCSLRYC